MIKLHEFTQHLEKVKSGKANFNPLYILSTDEPLLMTEAQDLFRGIAKNKGYTERESLMHDGHFDWESLVGGNQNMSLFSEKKLTELWIPTGKPGREGADVLKQFAKQIAENSSPEPDNITLIYLPKLDGQTSKSAWFSALDENGVVVRIDTLERSMLPQWIKERLARQNQSLESGGAGERAIQFLVDQFEGNLIAAHQEIQKLGLLYPEGVLTEDQVRDAVLNVARYDVFQIAEAFLTGNMARINRMLDGLRGEGEALVLIVWSLAEEIRTLHALKKAAMEGQSLANLMRSRRIWGKREQLIPQTLERVNLPILDRALAMIADIDRQSKGIPAKDMPSDPWDGLRRIGGLFSLK